MGEESTNSSYRSNGGAAERLKCIGEDRRIVQLTAQLPPDWVCIYEITTLKGNDFSPFCPWQER